MKLRFPTAYTILVGLIALVVIATWYIPAGQYERIENADLCRLAVVPGICQFVEPQPQGIFGIDLAKMAGLNDLGSPERRAGQFAPLVLVIAGCLSAFAKTGAVYAGVVRGMIRLESCEKWTRPILMAAFSDGSSVYGLMKESLAFFTLIIPVMIVARYDVLSGLD